MLRFGSFRARDCGRVTRRALLQAGVLGPLGLSLADLDRLEAPAAEPVPRDSSSREAGSRKSVILLWLWGGPSHLDTFDLKPGAPVEYRGPYAPISTAVPGTQICELLPELARRADRYSLIRSLRSGSEDHGIAGTIGLTGSNSGARSLGGQTLPGEVKPTHGSVLARALELPATSPQFVTLGGFLNQGHQPITGEGSSTLGPLYDPFRLDYHPVRGVQIPQLELLPGLTTEGLASRRNLLTALDQLAARVDDSPAVRRLDSVYQRAFSLLTSGESRRMFDLDQEPSELRDRYGRHRFGQCCLLARRLIETGVRFVQVNWSGHVEPLEDTGDGGWDMHDRFFAQFQERHAWMLDQSLSTLLDDLRDRGRLDDTLVVAVGEFGRTPRINGKAGRDHWPHCYSGLVAGGGLRAGLVIGASDRLGERPAQRPIAPADLFTTVLEQAGVSTTRLTSAGLLPLGNAIEELRG